MYHSLVSPSFLFCTLSNNPGLVDFCVSMWSLWKESIQFAVSSWCKVEMADTLPRNLQEKLLGLSFCTNGFVEPSSQQRKVPISTFRRNGKRRHFSSCCDHVTLHSQNGILLFYYRHLNIFLFATWRLTF